MSLINKSNCKKFILDFAEREKFHKFTRVSADCWPHLEAKLRAHLRNLVNSQPSKGKTVKP